MAVTDQTVLPESHPSDLNLFVSTHDVDEAIDELCGFYANYQSQRYVDGMLVLRLIQAPDTPALAELSREYADMLVDGEIEQVAATPAETRDDDALHLDRVRLHFDRRSFGRLRQLIDRLNELVETPTNVNPPSPFGADQADREW